MKKQIGIKEEIYSEGKEKTCRRKRENQENGTPLCFFPRFILICHLNFISKLLN